MNEQAEKALLKARTSLILHSPFFTATLLKHELFEDEQCETAWIDGVKIGYNPKFILSLIHDEIIGLLCHEVLHVMLLHHLRRNNRDSKRWNIAGDYAINNLILDDNTLKLPKRGLMGQYKGLSTEAIYNLLPVEEKDEQGKPKLGEVRDFPGKDGKEVTKEEMQKAEQEIKKVISQSKQIAKNRGKLSTGMERICNEVLISKINWVEELREYIQTSTKSRYTLSKPNRRYLSSDLYLPSLSGMDNIGSIVIAVDTSGSVSNKMMTRFASEISSILENYKAEIKVIYCDSSIKGIEDFTQDDLPIKLNARGGGGTSFVPVFDYVKKEELELSVLIYLTDMDAYIPNIQPDYPVLWINTGYYEETAPFGKVVRVIE